ncbi:MAG TPA: bacterioferritin, partial [Thermoanaerobaculia bacterium]
MEERAFDRAAVLTTLNRILETELAGVVRYTHYSLMIFGYNRI